MSTYDSTIMPKGLYIDTQTLITSIGLNVKPTTPTLEVLSEKLINYQSFIQQPIITKEKKHYGMIKLINESKRLILI